MGRIIFIFREKPKIPIIVIGLPHGSLLGLAGLRARPIPVIQLVAEKQVEREELYELDLVLRKVPEIPIIIMDKVSHKYGSDGRIGNIAVRKYRPRTRRVYFPPKIPR
jgi:hypothetical protein